MVLAPRKFPTHSPRLTLGVHYYAWFVQRQVPQRKTHLGSGSRREDRSRACGPCRQFQILGGDEWCDDGWWGQVAGAQSLCVGLEGHVHMQIVSPGAGGCNKLKPPTSILRLALAFS